MENVIRSSRRISSKVVLSRKSQKVTHPIVYFNNSPVIRCFSQKHLGIHLDEKLNVIHHIKDNISIANKGVGVRKLNNTLPRKALLTLYLSFGRSHCNHGDIIYETFAINLKLFNKMQYWLLLGQFREHQKQNYIRNWVLNCLN